MDLEFDSLLPDTAKISTKQPPDFYAGLTCFSVSPDEMENFKDTCRLYLSTLPEVRNQCYIAGTASFTREYDDRYKKYQYNLAYKGLRVTREAG